MDLVAWDDLDSTGAELNDPIAELEQDLYHRIIEPLGSNIDDPTRGFGIYRRLNKPFDAKIGKLLELELLNDERLDSCTVTVTDTGNGTYIIQIDGTADGAALGLTLATTPSTVAVVNK